MGRPRPRTTRGLRAGWAVVWRIFRALVVMHRHARTTHARLCTQVDVRGVGKEVWLILRARHGGGPQITAPTLKNFDDAVVES